MAKKISQLTQATEVKSDDVTVIVQDGETKKLPLNMMVTKQDIENKKVAGLAKLDEIEATYENDTYTPTITVKNKSSVKTGEGDEVDYSANVMDGHVKSAILTGSTLVNVFNNSLLYGGHNYTLNSDGSITMNAIGNYTECNFKLSSYVGKTVTIFIIFDENTIDVENYNLQLPIFGYTKFSRKENRYLKKYVGVVEDGNLRFGLTPNVTSGSIKFKFMAIEGNFLNQDIPYFTGMQSVKMPVLTTTGKNLFDVNKGFTTVWQCSYTIGSDGSITIKPTSTSGVSYIVTETIELEVGKTYRLTWNETGNTRTSYMWLEGTTNGGVYNINKPFTVQEGKNRVRLAMYVDNTSLNNTVTFKPLLEQGTSATTYEPYKTNILTVSEDLTLRGIGDAKDTLDCLTGEIIQCIGEVVLDGSENWQEYNTNNVNTYCVLNVGLITDYKGTDYLNNKLNKLDDSDIDIEGIRINKSKRIFIRLNRDKGITNLTTFKQYLSQNPITIQYEMIAESIKTVDLIPSGTHPSTTPYCWKDGHIQLSSSGLLPNLEYSVVTSRAGQISQNAAMNVKNDKRIFDLEILLAGGLVNTTYQALTLQNQVETGLSKVSLSSEKEPDYLLYHMIMKLIEEKAYKLDDLAEKVSVFYLYEKLSDEQFETIYSELYPFVEEEYIELPEDGEIIEEPIVDELPKEVEDGVVM